MPFCSRGLSDDVCSDQCGLATLAIFSSELPLAPFSSPLTSWVSKPTLEQPLSTVVCKTTSLSALYNVVYLNSFLKWGFTHTLSIYFSPSYMYGPLSNSRSHIPWTKIAVLSVHCWLSTFVLRHTDYSGLSTTGTGNNWELSMEA